MVIISAGICDKNGQIILSRQFQSITKSALEDLYFSFPKLIKHGQQHTYVQSDRNTFLYMPVQGLYLVLVSTRNSNIIENQQTIRMVYKILMAVCLQGISEQSVQKNSIDILLGIDDIISMGYRESVTIQQVCDQLKMDSAQQKSHIALLKQQQQDVKEAIKKKMQEAAMNRK